MSPPVRTTPSSPCSTALSTPPAATPTASWAPTCPPWPWMTTPPFPWPCPRWKA